MSRYIESSWLAEKRLYRNLITVARILENTDKWTGSHPGKVDHGNAFYWTKTGTRYFVQVYYEY